MVFLPRVSTSSREALTNQKRSPVPSKLTEEAKLVSEDLEHRLHPQISLVLSDTIKKSEVEAPASAIQGNAAFRRSFNLWIDQSNCDQLFPQGLAIGSIPGANAKHAACSFKPQLTITLPLRLDVELIRRRLLRKVAMCCSIFVNIRR